MYLKETPSLDRLESSDLYEVMSQFNRKYYINSAYQPFYISHISPYTSTIPDILKKESQAIFAHSTLPHSFPDPKFIQTPKPNHRSLVTVAVTVTIPTVTVSFSGPTGMIVILFGSSTGVAFGFGVGVGGGEGLAVVERVSVIVISVFGISSEGTAFVGIGVAVLVLVKVIVPIIIVESATVGAGGGGDGSGRVVEAGGAFVGAPGAPSPANILFAEVLSVQPTNTPRVSFMGRAKHASPVPQIAITKWPSLLQFPTLPEIQAMEPDVQVEEKVTLEKKVL